MTPREALAHYVGAALQSETMDALGARCGLHKNYVFRASVGESGKNGKQYDPVVPANLSRLLDGLGLTIAPQPGPATLGEVTAAIQRLDCPEWKRGCLVAAVRGIWVVQGAGR